MVLGYHSTKLIIYPDPDQSKKSHWMFAIRKPTLPKILWTLIHSFLSNSIQCLKVKCSISLCWWHGKSIVDRDPDSGSILKSNLIDLSLAKVLSFHKIWFKSANNFLRYPAHIHIHTQTDLSHYLRNDPLAEVITTDTKVQAYPIESGYRTWLQFTPSLTQTLMVIDFKSAHKLTKTFAASKM